MDATEQAKAVAWIVKGDTGISSETIWSVMMGNLLSAPDWPSPPRDPADFGRCYRLLQLIPSWRTRMHEVSAAYPEWVPFIRDWQTLEHLYETAIALEAKTAPELYEALQRLWKEVG